MIGLGDENESIRFENYLLLSLFLTHIDLIDNDKVKLLIIKNKSNFLLALSHVHPEHFDSQCEYGVCRDELEQILRKISAGV